MRSQYKRLDTSGHFPDFKHTAKGQRDNKKIRAKKERRIMREWIINSKLDDPEQRMEDGLDLVCKLVRCKDCIYWQDNNGGYPHSDCKWNHDETPVPDDFCSAGERKE